MKTVTKCILLLSLFAILCLQRFDGIHGQDEISHSMKLIRLLFRDGFSRPWDVMVFSPHLYQLSAWGISSLFGDVNSFTMRLTGLLFWLMTLSCVAWVCRKSSCALSLLLCISAPMVVSSTAIVEIDQAVMPFLTLLLVMAQVRWLESPRQMLPGVCVALSFCLCLWGRLSVPLALAPLLLAFAYFQSRSVCRTARLAVFLLIGAVCFACSWWLYGMLTGIHWQGIYEYLAQSFAETTIGARHAGFSRLCISLQSLVLWGMTPYFLLMLIHILRNVAEKLRQRGPLPADMLYGISALWLLAGFAVVGGSLFGFPKYQVAAFPLAAIAMALSCRNHDDGCTTPERTDGWRLALFVCIAFAASWFIIEDPIYTLRIHLREAVLAGEPPAGILLPLVARMAAAHAAILMSGLWLWRKWHLKPCILLIAAGIAVNAALLIRQSASGYNCGYMYGDQGDTRAVAAFINDNGYDPSRTLVPHEVLDVFNKPELTEPFPFLLTTPEDLLKRLETDQTDVLAVSFLTFPVSAIRDFTQDAALYKMLFSRYDFRAIGRYLVFSRKTDATPQE